MTMQPNPYAQLGPYDQFRRFLATTQPTRTGWERDAMQRAAMPAYGLYQAMAEPSGAYATFGDFLGGAGGGQGWQANLPTALELERRVQNVAQMNPETGAFTGAAAGLLDDPYAYGQYYGGGEGGISPADAAANQQQLATTLALSGRGQAMYNPRVQSAIQSAISRMYENYLTGQGSQFGTAGPTGFLKYYMGQRGTPAIDAAAAAQA